MSDTWACFSALSRAHHDVSAHWHTLMLYFIKSNLQTCANAFSWIIQNLLFFPWMSGLCQIFFFGCETTFQTHPRLIWCLSSTERPEVNQMSLTNPELLDSVLGSLLSDTHGPLLTSWWSQDWKPPEEPTQWKLLTTSSRTWWQISQQHDVTAASSQKMKFNTH